ncbi:predicted protein [Botrytis cinerea T4]|uniref:Uncharacterized protein n=1 Tax=Botryotinia fuckeliana (strain T4) TaxID=999810 RepID=G2Y643_BOTF4|nr:predicted protein [Botrytis cinerea T4]
MTPTCDGFPHSEPKLGVACQYNSDATPTYQRSWGAFKISYHATGGP